MSVKDILVSLERSKYQNQVVSKERWSLNKMVS